MIYVPLAARVLVRSRKALPLNPLTPLNELLKRYYTIQEGFERFEQDVRDIRREIAALRDDHSDLKNRVSRLEEARNTTAAEVRAIIAETVGDLRVKFTEAQAEIRIKAAEAQVAALPPLLRKDRNESEP